MDCQDNFVKRMIEDFVPIHKFLGLQLLDIKKDDVKIRVPFRAEVVVDIRSNRWHGGIEFSSLRVSNVLSSSRFNVSSSLIVYANPANNRLNIVYEVKQLGSVIIHIYDASGKEVYKKKDAAVVIGKQTNDLSLVSNNLASGLYIIKVVTPTNIFNGKVFLQKR
jgi:hypothetical protein